MNSFLPGQEPPLQMSRKVPDVWGRWWRWMPLRVVSSLHEPLPAPTSGDEAVRALSPGREEMQVLCGETGRGGETEMSPQPWRSLCLPCEPPIREQGALPRWLRSETTLFRSRQDALRKRHSLNWDEQSPSQFTSA